MDADRAAILARVLGDDILVAMRALRAALARYSAAPRNTVAQEALINALEDVMALQVNRIQGTTGAVLVGPIEDLAQLRFDEDKLAMRIGDIEEERRVEHERAASTPDPFDLEERIEALEDPPEERP
jgi:hypothetical protein